jgi:hypothetical protein
MMQRTNKQHHKYYAQPRRDFSAFLDVVAAADVTPYMHFVVSHFPTWMEAHGSIDRYNAQCMEHANRDMHGPALRAQSHMPKRKAYAVKLELEEQAPKRIKSEIL